jgi:hypothetical protein
MKTKTKLIILISVLSVCIVATATGFTVAYWMGADGTNQIAPQTDTTDWNYWTKYLIYEEVKNSQGNVIGYKAVDFEGAVLENIIIPRFAKGGKVRHDDGTMTEITSANAPVLIVGNTLFADTTDKMIPVTLTLPTTVDVEAGAFAGLTNLTKITIKQVKSHAGNTNDDDIKIGLNAFFGCDNVKQFVAAENIAITVPGASTSTFDDFKVATGLSNDDLVRSNG